MLFIVGFYLLNILDANIDAHLKQYNVSSELSFKPYFDTTVNTPSAGMRIALTFRYENSTSWIRKNGQSDRGYSAKTRTPDCCKN